MASRKDYGRKPLQVGEFMEGPDLAQGRAESAAGPKARRLRIAIVAILVLLTAQGWTGDTVNIFFAPPNGTAPPPQTLGGFFGAVQSLGAILVWHAVEGIVILAIALVILVLAFLWSQARSVRISAILATAFAISAVVGGYLFVMSGFSTGGTSAQMGGSYIGTYAFYFITLYYAK